MVVVQTTRVVMTMIKVTDPKLRGKDGKTGRGVIEGHSVGPVADVEMLCGGCSDPGSIWWTNFLCRQSNCLQLLTRYSNAQ
jgi:hypothetical protein